MLDLLLRIVSTAATLIIGVAASILAYQQFRISKAKLKLDLYEKRLALFRVANEFAITISTKVFTASDIRIATDKFAQDKVEVVFLFDSYVGPFLTEMYLKASELADVEYRRSDSSEGSIELSRRATELRKWFSEMTVDMVDVFQRELSVKSLD